MSLGHGAPRRGAPTLITVVGVLFALVLLVSSFFPTSRVLVIQAVGQATHIYEVAIGDKVTNYFVHSVERTPVFEYFAVEARGFRLTGTRLKSYNAGTTTDSPPGFRVEEGWVFVPQDKPLSQLNLIVSSDTAQAILVENIWIDLAQFPRGTRVDVYVSTRPVVWLRLRRVLS